MSKSIDWAPHTRTGLLSMALNWCNIFPEEVKTGTEIKKKYELWLIPKEEVTALMDAYTVAREALETAKNEEKDTTVATKICQDTFEKLEAIMRRLKKFYLHIPPLTEVDMISLGLKVPDTVRNPTGEPACQIQIIAYHTGGLYEVGAKLDFIKGSANDPAIKEFRIYYKVVGPGEPEPKSVKELTESFGTLRKGRNTIELTPDDSSKRIFMAARAENGKKKGPWGPIVSAVIP